jgi:oligopeptide transport system permease protein
MNRYIARRLLQFIPVFFGALAFLFTAMFILPGDPVQAQVGERRVNEEFRQAYIERYGLDDPLPVQFGRYVGRVMRLDFGESSGENRPVSTIIKERLPTTARLAGAGAFFLILMGIGSGVIAAVKRYTPTDAIVTLGTTLLVSVPVFVLGVLMQVFALKTQFLPISGLDDGLKSYILPGFVLASVSAAYLSRLQRTALLETLNADYVRTARAKGLRERRVIFNHAWRNALIPVVTYLGLDLGTYLGGAILTETIFNINGLGRTIVTGVTGQDNALVLGVSSFIVIVYLVANLLVDIGYAALDPRIRYE